MPHIRLPARLENIGAMVSLLKSYARDLGFSRDTMLDMELALEEVLVNVCNYGFPEKAGQMEVSCAQENQGQLVVTVKDNGVAFDPCAAPGPDLDADLQHRKVGGLGILLARSMAADFHYQRYDEMNIVVMTFSPKNKQSIGE